MRDYVRNRLTANFASSRTMCVRSGSKIRLLAAICEKIPAPWIEGMLFFRILEPKCKLKENAFE
jgi:hypothetical protein